VNVWDTIPALITWGGFLNPHAGDGVRAGNLLNWDLGTLSPQQCETVVWWGTINGVPENPFETEKYFAVKPGFRINEMKQVYLTKEGALK